MKLFLYCFYHNMGLVISCTLQAAAPKQCAAIKPPKHATVSLVHWVLDRGPRLKQHGCWKKHLELGVMALKYAAYNTNRTF